MLARGMRCWMASALCLLKSQAKRVLHQVFEPQQDPPGRLCTSMLRRSVV